jgi:hypothetical protein
MDNPETRATLGTQDTREDKTKNRTDKGYSRNARCILN